MSSRCSEKCPGEVSDEEALGVFSKDENMIPKWVNMFFNSLVRHGMPLSYIPLEIRDERLMIKIKPQEVRMVEQSWENDVMIFTPNEGIKMVNIRIKCMVQHKEGYFVV